VIEHRDLLDDPQRIVPREHDHHRPDRDPRRARRDPREELQDVGTHRVVGEVVLDAPDGVEAERLGEVGQPELARVDVVVGAAIEGVLEEGRHADAHDAHSSRSPRADTTGRSC
jgi:hypothetical protein